MVVCLTVGATLLAGCSESSRTPEKPLPGAQAREPAAETARRQSSPGDRRSHKPSPATIEHRFDIPLSRENERDAQGFIPLTLADFEFFGPDVESQRAAWSERDGILVTTGRPRGYAYTRRAFENFDLQFEYRFPENLPEDGTDPNTGVLLFLTGPHRVWPACLEVQGKFSETAGIKSNSRDVTVEASDDDQARTAARRPVGQWNTIRIEARGGRLRTFLNGRPIATCKPTPLVAGPIGLQSEGFAVEFRGLRIRPLPSDRDAGAPRPAASAPPGQSARN